MQRRAACAAAFLGAAAASLGAGCSVLTRPATVPMTVLHVPDACATRADALLVMLPGAYMALEELQREGFVNAVRQRGLAVDMALADSHLGYVYDRSLFDRLHQDVIAPARAQGWQRIWLAGISLGGYAAMGYALRHPGMVQGIFAIAPYLGRPALVQQMAAARAQGQSLQQALQGVAPQGEDDADHALWRWLVQRPADGPQLHLGYGLQDRLAAGHALMAQTLPLQHVITEPGGHDWPPWRTLWARWLDQGLLPARCAA